MRLIDADKLVPDVMKVDGSMAISQGQLAHAKTIEAIPKDRYEARLKADLEAILVELQLEIEEKKFLESSCSFMDKTEEKNYAVYTDDISDIIQQKIDALKGRK